MLYEVMWYQKVLQIFKIKDLRNKILFVLGVLVVFRISANIPVPGIDLEKIKSFFEGNQLLGLLNIFTGGALSKLSIMMIGLSPYITAIIVMQLLTMIFPALEALYKEEGEAGRQKFNQYSRIFTVPLAILQGYGMITLLQSQNIIGQISIFEKAATIIIITAASTFLMWLGELISEKGIGNGISLLIFAGIVAQLPASVRAIFLNWDASLLPSYIGFVVIAVLVIVGVIIITEGRRNIPVSYAKRIRGNKIYGGVSTYLPLNVNPAGVIPIIFALSLMLFPGMIGSFFANSSVAWVAKSATFLKDHFQSQGFWYGAIYFVMVILFTFFYTAVTFDPKNVAENLQKSGGFIPGIRPGKNTSEFLTFILNRVLLVGAIFLGLIAVMPYIVRSATDMSNLTIGGTSVLIVVSVVLETVRQIESQLTMREYEGF